MAATYQRNRQRYSVDFFLQQSVWLYVMVFVGKILNNMIITVKTIILNHGESFKAAVLTFLQTVLFLFVTGSVLAGLTTDILRVVVYVVAAMLGNSLGSFIEGKLAFGLSSVQVIVPKEDGEGYNLAEKLRGEGFAVTTLDGEGSLGMRDVLVLHLKRKKIPKVKAIVHDFLSDAVIVENEVKMMDGGYLEK